MARLPEPDDVDVVVTSGDDDPQSIQETIDFIKAHKNRAEFSSEVDEAKAILGAIGIDPKAHGREHAEALLAHWKRCVADLPQEVEARASNGKLD